MSNRWKLPKLPPLRARSIGLLAGFLVDDVGEVLDFGDRVAQGFEVRVGLFNRIERLVVQPAAEPGAPPFVDTGQTVRKGQVLCIIEAMKLMNEINAECDGEIVKVYVENGQAVQYGERLFAIRPS